MQALEKPRIAIVGTYQNGKSTLVNCLLDEWVARTGLGTATTHIYTRYQWGNLQAVTLTSRDGKPRLLRLREFLDSKADWSKEYSSADVYLWKPLLSHIDLLDTPGFNADSSDDTLAHDGIDQADFAMLVVENRQLSTSETEVLQHLRERLLPFCVVMNCKPQGGATASWDPANEANQERAQTIEQQIQSLGLTPISIAGRRVVPCNLAWYWYATGHSEKNKSENTLTEQVEAHFFDRKARRQRCSFLEISVQSGFDPVRQYLQCQPWQALTPGCIPVRTAIFRVFRRWKKDLARLETLSRQI